MKINNYKTSIFLSLAFNILSKGLLFLVNIFIAYYFGATISTDIYFFILALILLVANILLGITGAVVIPEFMRKQSEVSDSEGHSFINRIFLWTLLCLLLLCAILWLYPVTIFSFFSSFDQGALQTNVDLIHIGLLVLVLQGIVTFLNEILVAKRYFIIPSIVAIVNSLVVIIFISVFYEIHGLRSIFLANLVALSFSLIVQATILGRYEKWKFLSVKTCRSKGLNADFFYASLSTIATTVVAFYPIYLLSKFGGTLTEFNYAQRVSEIPNSLLVLQFCSIVAIRFNELFPRGDLKEINSTYVRSAKTLLFILVPLSLLIYYFGREISTLLFLRGALSQDSLYDVADFISILILATPFVGLSYLTTKAMMAARKVKENVVLQAVMIALHGVLLFLGVYLFGAKGYAWGYVCYQLIYSISLYFFLKKYLPYISYGVSFKYIILLFIYSAGMIFTVALFIEPLRESLSALTYLLIGSLGFILLLLVANRIFKINSDIAIFERQLYNKLTFLLKK